MKLFRLLQLHSISGRLSKSFSYKLPIPYIKFPLLSTETWKVYRTKKSLNNFYVIPLGF
jgi:hypothetical protein